MQKALLIRVKKYKYLKDYKLTLRISKNKNNLVLNISTNKSATENDIRYILKVKKEWINKNVEILRNKLDKNIENENNLIQEYIRNNGNNLVIFNLKYKIDSLNPEIIQHILTQKSQQICDKYSQLMGVRASGIKIKFIRSYIGKCSYHNLITLSISNILASIETLEYLIIHELSHIVHKNHSKNFWGLVSRFCPDYGELDSKLKKHNSFNIALLKHYKLL